LKREGFCRGSQRSSTEREPELKDVSGAFEVLVGSSELLRFYTTSPWSRGPVVVLGEVLVEEGSGFL